MGNLNVSTLPKNKEIKINLKREKKKKKKGFGLFFPKNALSPKKKKKKLIKKPNFRNLKWGAGSLKNPKKIP